MDGALVAQFGQVHADIASARKLRQSVFIAELYLDRLYPQGLRRGSLPAFAAISGRGAGFFICVCRWCCVREDSADCPQARPDSIAAVLFQ